MSTELPYANSVLVEIDWPTKTNRHGFVKRNVPIELATALEIGSADQRAIAEVRIAAYLHDEKNLSERLKKVPSHTTRAALAMDLFGRTKGMGLLK